MPPEPPNSHQNTELMRLLESAFSKGVQHDPASLFKARETVGQLASNMREAQGEQGQGVFTVLQILIEHVLKDQAIGTNSANEMAAELIRELSRELKPSAPPRKMTHSTKSAVGSVADLLGNARKPLRVLAFRSSTDERIGELLLRTGRINRKQLSQAIIAQKISHKLLGEVLVELDAISMTVLYSALEEQREQAGGLSMRRIRPS
jgi:hypothetical protein